MASVQLTSECATWLLVLTFDNNGILMQTSSIHQSETLDLVFERVHPEIWTACDIFEQGVFKGFVGTTMDVTERELLMRELRREQAYLAGAQSLAHIGQLATNFATGKIFLISDETVRLYGFDPRQGRVPYERFYATIHPEDEPAVRTTLENAIRTKTEYDHKFRICLPDSSIRFHRAIGHEHESRR
ncbi:MAG TPA: PAS domain-containing protein [Terriglobales bacterium]|nr:PAS domain-containing protein [Terriglobales bacterium]